MLCGAAPHLLPDASSDLLVVSALVVDRQPGFAEHAPQCRERMIAACLPNVGRAGSAPNASRFSSERSGPLQLDLADLQRRAGGHHDVGRLCPQRGPRAAVHPRPARGVQEVTRPVAPYGLASRFMPRPTKSRSLEPQLHAPMVAFEPQRTSGCESRARAERRPRSAPLRRPSIRGRDLVHSTVPFAGGEGITDRGVG